MKTGTLVLHSAYSLIALLCLAFQSGAIAQDAKVTFYSHGRNLSGFPGSKHGVFEGCIYDGSQRLACFDDGFLGQNNRFVVFDLVPGAHVFSACYCKRPKTKSQFPLFLEPGKNYYLRAQSESRGILVIEVDSGRLDQVTCAMAQHETEKATLLKPKAIPPQMTASLDAIQAKPSCP